MQLQGTLCFDAEAILKINSELEAKRKRDADSLTVEEDLELFELKPLIVDAADRLLQRKLEDEISLSSEILRHKRLNRILDLDESIAYDLDVERRANEAFWRGDYDPSRRQDIPAVGSLDLRFLARLFSKTGKR